MRISDWSSDVCSSDLFVVCAWVIDLRQFHVSIWQPENVLGGIVGSSSAIGRRKERAQHEFEIGKTFIGPTHVKNTRLFLVLLDMAQDEQCLAMRLSATASTA